eukprot:354903-Chlamydomonas_euryale.AAC.7
MSHNAACHVLNRINLERAVRPAQAHRTGGRRVEGGSAMHRCVIASFLSHRLASPLRTTTHPSAAPPDADAAPFAFAGRRPHGGARGEEAARGDQRLRPHWPQLPALLGGPHQLDARRRRGERLRRCQAGVAPAEVRLHPGHVRRRGQGCGRLHHFGQWQVDQDCVEP